MDKESKDIPTLPKGFDVLLCINTVGFLGEHGEPLLFIKGGTYEKNGNKLFAFSSAYKDLYINLDRKTIEEVNEYFIINPTYEQIILTQKSAEDSLIKVSKELIELIEKYGGSVTFKKCLENLELKQKKSIMERFTI